MSKSAGALLLLAAGVAAQFLWRSAPASVSADVWNASQAALVVALLCVVIASVQSGAVRFVCLLLGSWQLMTAGCSVLYLIRPWSVIPGQAQCSAALDLPLGAISGLFALLLAWRIYREREDG